MCGGGVGGGGGGGGGTLTFSSYVGLGPESTVCRQKNRYYQAPQKILEIFATQKYFHSVHLS